MCSFQHNLFTHLHTTQFEAMAIYYCMAPSVHHSFCTSSVLFFHPTLECSDFCSSTQSFLNTSTQGWASVDGALEDEFDVALLPCQPGTTEGAGSMEGMGAVGQRDLAPPHHSLF